MIEDVYEVLNSKIKHKQKDQNNLKS